MMVAGICLDTILSKMVGASLSAWLPGTRGCRGQRARREEEGARERARQGGVGRRRRMAAGVLARRPGWRRCNDCEVSTIGAEQKLWKLSLDSLLRQLLQASTRVTDPRAATGLTRPRPAPHAPLTTSPWRSRHAWGPKLSSMLSDRSLAGRSLFELLEAAWEITFSVI